jgi:hypothetical protein
VPLALRDRIEMRQKIPGRKGNHPALIRTQLASLGEHPVERLAGADEFLDFSAETIHTGLLINGILGAPRRDMCVAALNVRYNETGAGGARIPWL